MTYPKLGAQATVSVSLDTPTASNSIVVTGTKGTLSAVFSLSAVCQIIARCAWADLSDAYTRVSVAALHGASPYPSSFTVLLFDKPDEPQTFHHPITPNHGRGMAWQADAVARSLRDGRTEEPRMPWEETILQHEVLDAVVHSGGLADEIAKLA